MSNLDVTVCTPTYTEKIALCNLPKDVKHLNLNRRVGTIVTSELKSNSVELTIQDRIFLIDSLAASFDIPLFYRCKKSITPGSYDGFFTLSN